MKEEWQDEQDMVTFKCHKGVVKQRAPCVCSTTWYIMGLALMKLKQWNRSLNWDFQDFNIIKSCLTNSQEQHKYSWILSGAVWWNRLLFEVSSSLMNPQHLCSLVSTRLYIVHSQMLWLAGLPVCDVSKVKRCVSGEVQNLPCNLLFRIKSDIHSSLLS